MENPGKTELNRILQCMKDYEYDETYLEPGEFDTDYKFKLIKRMQDINSNDHTIRVTIDFPTVIDDDNTYTNDDDGDFYNIENNDKAHQFIKNLITHNLTKKGGKKKKQRKTRKTRKTRKNKK
jgi:hypothetical protein